MDRLMRTIEKQDQVERVLIIERADGLFTYRMQTHFRKTGWSAPGPDCGLYPDPDTAEDEARSRVWWMSD